jgi:hypothetical protein
VAEQIGPVAGDLDIHDVVIADAINLLDGKAGHGQRFPGDRGVGKVGGVLAEPFEAGLHEEKRGGTGEKRPVR